MTTVIIITVTLAITLKIVTIIAILIVGERQSEREEEAAKVRAPQRRPPGKPLPQHKEGDEKQAQQHHGPEAPRPHLSHGAGGCATHDVGHLEGPDQQRAEELPRVQKAGARARDPPVESMTSQQKVTCILTDCS